MGATHSSCRHAVYAILKKVKDLFLTQVFILTRVRIGVFNPQGFWHPSVGPRVDMNRPSTIIILPLPNRLGSCG